MAWSRASGTAPTRTCSGRRITPDLRRLGLVCGLAGPIVWLTLIAAGDLYRPDISAVTDFISELGERGSSTETLLRVAGFIGTGVLYLGVAAALPAALSPRWRAASVGLFVAVEGVGRIGAGVYPCDPGCDGSSPSQELHRLFATIGFCSGILAALSAGVLFRNGFSLLSGIATTVFLLLMTWVDNPVHAAGLWERLATGALSVWLLVWTTRTMRWRSPRPG